MEVASQGNIYCYNAEFAGDHRDVVAELAPLMWFWCPQATLPAEYNKPYQLVLRSRRLLPSYGICLNLKELA
jgi:hypothetical protein